VEKTVEIALFESFIFKYLAFRTPEY